jgi:hypothetical protein
MAKECNLGELEHVVPYHSERSRPPDTQRMEFLATDFGILRSRQRLPPLVVFPWPIANKDVYTG